MHAVLRPSHPTSWSRSTTRCGALSKRTSSFIDISYLISRLKPLCNTWPGSRLPDMPKKHETTSPKPAKSSNTRASSNLAVRQTPGTEKTGTARSRSEHNGGGSGAESASRRSHPKETTRSRGPEPPQTPADTSSDSGHSRSKRSLGPGAYIDTYVEYRKRLFIKIFMEKVDEWLDENVCPLEEAYDYEEGGPAGGGSRSSGAARTTGAGGGSGGTVAGTKRQLRGDDDREGENSEGDERSRRDRNKKRTKTEEDDDRLRFACPFYKFDPQRYKNHRSCYGPGWTTLHRLKEHIYRHHRLFTCARCCEHFKNEKSLEQHARAKTPCVLRDKGAREVDPGAGMDQETEKKLRSRKLSKQNDVKKWYEMYDTLFHGAVDADNLPSPYYDPAGAHGRDPMSSSESIKREYERFLRRTLPAMIREELEAEVENSLRDVGSALQGRLAVWIRNSAARCAKIFDYIPSPSEAAAQGDPDAAGPRSREASPTSPPPPNGAGGGKPAEDAAAHWSYELPRLEDFDFDIALPLENYPAYEDCLPTFDSAYGSGSAGVSSEAWR